MYDSLIDYCEVSAGRWRVFPRGIRRRIIEGIIADWPERVRDPADIADVLVKRGRERIRREHGSVLLLILAPILAELVKLAIQWWLDRRANQVLMRAWNAEANR